MTPFDLPGSEDPLTQEALTLADKLHLSYRYRELDERPEFPWKEYREFGRANLLGLARPEAVGGRAVPLKQVGGLLFRIAMVGGTSFAKLLLQPDFTSVLGDQGSPELVDRYFRPMMRGEMLVGNQVSEPNAGSDLGNLELSAESAGDYFVLNGTKTGIAFALDAHAATVYARTARDRVKKGSATTFLVPQDLKGIHRFLAPPDVGERWMRRGSIRYTDVRVPAENILGEEGQGFGYLRSELRRERTLLGAVYLGAAEASWRETVDSVGKRQTFGSPLSSHEAVGFSLAEDRARLDSSWLYVHRTLERLDRGEEADREAALSKWLAVETALTAIDHAVQFHGSRGYSSELPHAQRWRDVRSGRIAHGTSEMMLRVAQHSLWPRSPPS